VNSFESPSTETEQLETEKRVAPVASPIPVSVPVSLPEVEDKKDQAITDHLTPSKIFEMAATPLNLSELAYSCLLIPRFSDHYLAGDITKDLATWMKEICISYGWRLDAIAIRPGYIQWIMTVPLTSNPARFMKIICQQTSQKILEDYPRFKRKNLSLDFWAPGFSVVHGNAPQSTEDINNFMLQIRRQQGIFEFIKK
jgi:REP element-mobilizing transposase RayT